MNTQTKAMASGRALDRTGMLVRRKATERGSRTCEPRTVAHAVPALVSRNRLVVLAPRAHILAGSFASTATSVAGRSHEDLLAEVQRLRAKVFVKEGTVRQSAITLDGRHVTPLDDTSWHLVLTGPAGEVLGCVRYTIYPETAGFDDLPFRDHPLAHSTTRFRAAVESVLVRARQSRRGFAQAGMWALAEEARIGSNALRMVLGTFALAQLLGDCYAICTAVLKHHSAMILQRLGAQPLRYGSAELGVYYDPHYQCDLRLLLFDSRKPNSRFAGMTSEILAELAKSAVILPS